MKKPPKRSIILKRIASLIENMDEFQNPALYDSLRRRSRANKYKNQGEFFRDEFERLLVDFEFLWAWAVEATVMLKAIQKSLGAKNQDEGKKPSQQVLQNFYGIRFIRTKADLEKSKWLQSIAENLDVSEREEIDIGEDIGEFDELLYGDDSIPF